MKKALLIFMLFFIITQSTTAQQKVKDKAKNRQLESLVFKKWSRSYFRPKWYYWLFHNKYRKGEDRRYIKQTLPTVATSIVERKETEKQADKVDKDYKDEIAIAIDHKFNYKYNMLYRDLFNKMFSKLYACNATLYYYTDWIIEHNMKVQMFKERHTLIKNSYRPSWEKNKEYDKLIEEMNVYGKYARMMVEKVQIVKKYKEKTMPIKD